MNVNPLGGLGNSLSQLNAPTPVQAPQNSSLLGVPNNNNANLSSLAALSNVVGGLGLGGVNALSNPLLSSAAASLNSLGINLNASSSNDVGQNQNQNLNQSSFNAYNTSGGGGGGGGYNSGRNDDLSFGGGNSQIRNYNTSNDDYNNSSRNFGNSNVSRKQPSDTILVRNVSLNLIDT